jgi:hypothetical protein
LPARVDPLVAGFQPLLGDRHLGRRPLGAAEGRLQLQQRALGRRDVRGLADALEVFLEFGDLPLEPLDLLQELAGVELSALPDRLESSM